MTIPAGSDEPEYLVECPYCRNNVKILRVIEGVWAITPENPDCDQCLLFISRMSGFLDIATDEEAIVMLRGHL